jgi:hypothetical protein
VNASQRAVKDANAAIAAAQQRFDRLTAATCTRSMMPYVTRLIEY